MSARKHPAPCDNPLCRRQIEPDRAHSLDLAQVRPDGTRGSWMLCDIGCLRQYLAICDVKSRADTERCPTCQHRHVNSTECCTLCGHRTVRP